MTGQIPIQTTDPDVIEAELILPEYTGIVSSIHDGFCFISKVKRATETIATNGDVFCPSDEFSVGELVTFHELNTDSKRPGKFRTESASKDNSQCLSGPVSGLGQTALEVHRTLNANLTAYHNQAKFATEEEKDQALANKPFDKYLKTMAGLTQESDTITDYAKQLLSDHCYPELVPFGVDFNVIGEIDEEAEQKRILEAATDFRDADMEQMAKALETQYENMAGVRRIFTMMHQQDILRLDTVLPMKHLPELFMACPVWFVESKESIPNNKSANDPLPDHVVKFFSDCVGTRNFAWLYQMYNRRTRRFNAFNGHGRDLMPPSLIKILKQAKEVFDYVAIITPYHDIASTEWADPNWQRSLDPFLVGFSRNVPLMFILGRWSGTGLFPLFLDMVVDTIAHLKSHKHLLTNFHEPYWYMGDTECGANAIISSRSADGDGHQLVHFTNKLLKAYKNGKIFDFLREQTPRLQATNS